MMNKSRRITRAPKSNAPASPKSKYMDAEEEEKKGVEKEQISSDDEMNDPNDKTNHPDVPPKP